MCVKLRSYIWVDEYTFFSELALGEVGAVLLRVNVGALLVSQLAVGEVPALDFLRSHLTSAFFAALWVVPPDVIPVGVQVNDGLAVGVQLHFLLSRISLLRSLLYSLLKLVASSLIVVVVSVSSY